MIPKKIHYCWFGGNPKPELAEKCIRSWKKYCKDYEIIEWNESNFDISSAPLYVRQAYENKKWAFVTDYVRLWAMVNYGGIYMDTDVEVLKPLDRFLVHEAFSGFETIESILTGIMACCKDFPLFTELLYEYNTMNFINLDGSLNTETNVIKITRLCSKYGFVPDGNYQIVNGLTLYPKDYFCPKTYSDDRHYKTKNTYTVHHYMGSWISDEDKKKFNLKRKKWKKDEKKLKRVQFFDKIIRFPNRLLIVILGQDRYNTLKKKLK